MSNYYNRQWRLPNNENKDKQSNYSMEFDGTNKTIATSYYWSTGNTAKSISLWFYKDSGSSEATLIGGGQNSPGKYFGLSSFTTNNRFKFDINPSINFSNNSAAIGQWQHVVVTAEPSGSDTILNGYVDGVLDSNFPHSVANGTTANPTTVAGGINTGSTAPVTIGENNVLNYNKFPNGKIDGIAIFDYALSQSQVTTLYGSSSTGIGNPMTLNPKPVAMYNLGDQDSFNGAEYLVPNASLKDFVFNNINSSAINTPYNLTATSNITVAIWFKTTTNAQSNKYLFSYGNSASIYDLRLNGTDAVQPIIKIAGVQRAPNISFNYADGNWHQYIVNYDGSNIKVYIDGILKNKSSYSGNLSVDSNNFVFANLTTTVGVTGEISNCTIHTATLTDGNVSEGDEATGEIATFYNYGTPIQTLSSIPQNSDLKVWYKLNASELYSDKWSVENNASPTTFKSALNFDGSNNYLQINTTNLGITFTASAWINPSGYGGAVLGGNTNNAYVFLIGGSNSVTVKFGGGYNVYTTSTISTGQWYHLAFIRTGTSGELFINGVSQGSNSTTLGEVDFEFQFIGSRSTSTQLFDGRISNVATYGTALSASNIQTLYNNGVPQATIYGSPVAHYKLDNTTSGIGNSLSPYSTALSFNSTKSDVDYVQFGNTSLSLPASLSIWLKPLGVPPTGYGMAYSDSSGRIYWTPSSNNMRYEITLAGAPQINSTLIAPADVGGWHHLVVTFTSTATKLYLDGQLNASGSGGTGTNFGQDINIGRWKEYPTNVNYGFPGSISNFAIFNSELSASQVSTLFNFGNPETNISFSPVHYWKLDNLTTGLNDTGSLASNNGTASSVYGTGPTTESGYVSILSGTNNGATEVATYVNRTAGTSSGMNQSALQQSDLSFTSGYSPYALAFDGTDDYIDLGTPAALNLTQNMSISAWINTNTIASGTRVIICDCNTPPSQSQFCLEINRTAGKISALANGTTVALTGSTTLSINTWYHVALTRSGSAGNWNYVIYLNGVVDGSVNTSSNPSSQQGVAIGRFGKDSSGYFNGSISDVQIFNTALPATGSNSVESLYNNGSPLTSMTGFTSLQAWYKLDASELYSDKWSVENNAIPTTFKSALNFDGSNDYIDLGNLQPSTTSLSISAWAYKTDATNASIIGRGASVDFNISIYSGSLIFGVNSGSWSTIAISNFTSNYLNQWFHVCATWDGSNMKLFLNGNEEASASKTGTITYTSNNTTIGKNSTLPNYEWDGRISNVAIYNTTLSPSNIQTLYNNGVPQATIYGSPVSHWKLDNTTTGIEDSAGSNDGTNNGAIEVATYVNTTAGTSSGMTQSALQQSDLSFKTSFSPYAFDFDGTNQTIGTNYYWPTGNTAKSISLWFYKDSGDATLIGGGQNSSGKYFGISSFNYESRFKIDIASNPTINFSNNSAATGKWQHVVVTAEPSGSDTILNGYVDGDLDSNFPQTFAGGINTGSTAPVTIGENNVLNYNKFPNGKISNISIWNTALTSSQVKEINNEGVPSNLNNHSAYSNLVSWWQLGSNSSFNTNWTVLDEKGSNNGTSVNMTEDDIVDGVGSYANGLSSGMGGDEVIGDAPYSSSNSLSVNMDVEDRVSDTPS